MPTVADIFLSSHYPSAWKCSDVVSRNFVSISPWSELKVNPLIHEILPFYQAGCQSRGPFLKDN